MIRMVGHRAAAFFLTGALVALAAACAEQPPPPPAPPPAYGPAPAYAVQSGVVPYATAPVEDDVEYMEDAPVEDVNAYPSVVYEGAPVYFIGGEWYEHDGHHGWEHFRHEPPALAQQREAHAHDPHWQRALAVPVKPQPTLRPPVRVTQPTPSPSPPASREGVAPQPIAPPRPEMTRPETFDHIFVPQPEAQPKKKPTAPEAHPIEQPIAPSAPRHVPPPPLPHEVPPPLPR